MGLPAQTITRKEYIPLPTIQLFHESPAQIRCIVGPVGSGKTCGASLEVGYYLPWFLFDEYNIKKTRWLVLRNSYRELEDSTRKTVMDWFPDAPLKVQANTLTITYDNGIQAELLFRSCDRPQDIKKFKSLEITGYWIDESIEVPEEIKRMLKNRIGRFPQKSPVRFGIETTNPPDVEHPTYFQFKWHTLPPGPIPAGDPLPNHAGFWQPPHENDHNLRPNYYADLRNDYKDSPDWIDMYVEGKPGLVIQGKLVYFNFHRTLHVAKEPLVWSKGELYRGWDNSGNTPACVVGQVPSAGRVQILKEYWTDRENMVDFTQRVVADCNISFPGATYTDYGDPAGANKFSTRDGDFTSNAKLMAGCGVEVISSEQNLTARISVVDSALGRYDALLIDPGCTRLINGFIGGYCYKEIGTTGVFQDKPNKNRFSHVHDSLQYLLIKLFKSTPRDSISPGFKPRRRWRQKSPR